MGTKAEARFDFIQERAEFADEARWMFEAAVIAAVSNQLIAARTRCRCQLIRHWSINGLSWVAETRGYPQRDKCRFR